MADTGTDQVDSAMNSLQINGDHSHNDEEKIVDPFLSEYGFDLEHLYKIALRFYKEKEGNSKVLQLTYRDKLRLVAFTKQVAYGKYRNDVTPEVGFLDVVGNDRRSTDPSQWQAWLQLGDMSKEQAMGEFVKYLDHLCPLFKPYVQAHKAEKDEQERKRIEEEERLKQDEEEAERRRMEDEAREQQANERLRQQQQETQIRAALNQQTAIQFRQYAEQQCPGNTEQQESLITQLQEQHFQQYMQQVYQQQLLHQQQQYQQIQAMQKQQQDKAQGVLQPNGGVIGDAQMSTKTMVEGHTILESVQSVGLSDGHVSSDANENAEEEEDDTDQNDLPPIAAASMWTRKDIREFKESIRKDPDSVIKVGSGETVTVRVPTHEDGTCLFWEFATDSYDVGFGVYFEWTISANNQVSVHVSESSDEEDVEDEEGGAADHKGDIEKGGSSAKKDNQPPTDEIIPVYRRDCHEEVYCGSHMYPGRGVYLLKFDNSYSLWRSKTLYYRVYYTR